MEGGTEEKRLEQKNKARTIVYKQGLIFIPHAFSN